MADRRQEEQKKKSHTGSKIVGGAVLLALLGGGGYFGLGIGNNNGGFLNPTQQKGDPTANATTVEAETTAEQTQAEPNTEEEGVLTVTVKEDKLVYRGETLSLKELEEALLRDYKDGVSVRVVDDHAIKSVYDELEALLQRLKITPEAQTP